MDDEQRQKEWTSGVQAMVWCLYNWNRSDIFSAAYVGAWEDRHEGYRVEKERMFESDRLLWYTTLDTDNRNRLMAAIYEKYRDESFR